MILHGIVLSLSLLVAGARAADVPAASPAAATVVVPAFDDRLNVVLNGGGMSDQLVLPGGSFPPPSGSVDVLATIGKKGSDTYASVEYAVTELPAGATLPLPSGIRLVTGGKPSWGSLYAPRAEPPDTTTVRVAGGAPFTADLRGVKFLPGQITEVSVSSSWPALVAAQDIARAQRHGRLAVILAGVGAGSGLLAGGLAASLGLEANNVAREGSATERPAEFKELADKHAALVGQASALGGTSAVLLAGAGVSIGWKFDLSRRAARARSILEDPIPFAPLVTNSTGG